MPAATVSSGPQIIIIDDDRFVRDFAVHTIEFGINRAVATFENGFHAWQYIQERPRHMDVIIADANIPEMSGLELLERIKTQYPQKNFIITSSNPAHEKAAHQKGADAFLCKPYGVNDLFAVIEQFMLRPSAE
ncbi:MAG: response regulator [Desulfobacteraceae bacterium]|nr:response regulator [Desulfobacteraceae bacterium]